MSTAEPCQGSSRAVTALVGATILRRRVGGAGFHAGHSERLHLAVALSYLLTSPYSVALERMRRSLRRFISHQRVDPRVYHETLTVFWMRRVLAFVERADETRGLAELANELLDACGDSRLVFDYYSKERLDSDKARRRWTDSDLRPIDF